MQTNNNTNEHVWDTHVCILDLAHQKATTTFFIFRFVSASSNTMNSLIMISRMARRTATPTMRVVGRTTTTTPFFFHHHRTLATSRTTLLELIQRERHEEIDEGRTEMPPQLVELQEELKKNAWKIVDDQGFTRLYRNHNSMKIQLSFHCQDMVTDQGLEDLDDDDVEPEQQLPPEDEHDDEVPGSVRFTATATPVKTGKTLIFQCTSEFGGAAIDGVSVTKDHDDVEQIHTSDEAKHNEYTGPVFAELAEDVRDAFQNFLEVDVGVSADVATFINTYADYKEQQNYVTFLKDVEEVLE